MRLLSAALVAGATLLGVSAISDPADAAVRGFATADVNQRAGPSTGYPVISVVPDGAPVTIYGCLGASSWCDVGWDGGRGWVSGNYLQALYSGRRVGIPAYYGPLAIPTISFSFGSYWDDHYHDRRFYRDRDRWRPGRHERREDRHDIRREKREVRQEKREFKGERREIREDIREADSRREKRQLRKELRHERRELQRERKEFRREREDILCPGPRCPR